MLSEFLKQTAGLDLAYEVAYVVDELELGFQLKTIQLLQSYYYKLNLEQQWKIRPVFQMHLPPPSIVARHFNAAFRMLVSATTITDGTPTVTSTSKFMSPWYFKQSPWNAPPFKVLHEVQCLKLILLK